MSNDDETTTSYDPVVEVVQFPEYFRIDMDYIPQHVAEGYHRSGWKFAMNALREHFAGVDTNFIFDGYLDRTFHWARDSLVESGLLPYKKQWVGVLHHTAIQGYSPHNASDLINDPYFRESLSLCRGIIVMSSYMSEWLQQQNLGVAVYTIYHPTEFVSKQFDLGRFLSEPKRQVVQIGGWLRDPYGIFALETDPRVIQKIALRGKCMSQYLPNDQATISITTDDTVGPDNPGCVLYSDDPDVQETCSGSGNKYYAALMKYIESKEATVHILDRLEDDDYDELLTKSVVFLRLEDASACNTVLECIARNTPVLVNRLPALEEYLGQGYPFFYDSLAEACQMVADANKVIETYHYLRTMDKTNYCRQAFVNMFGGVLSNLYMFMY